MSQSEIDKFRYFLKDSVRRTIDFSATDQSRGVAPPPLEKPYPADSELIDLVSSSGLKDITSQDLYSIIEQRRSHRKFLPVALTLKELSFLLWATQGIRKVAGPSTAFRTVPSAGSRHALETYLCIFRVEGIEEGIYRYLPVEHKLLPVSQPDQLSAKITTATLGQEFAGKSAVTFAWTAIPYRMEWRYGLAAHKVIAIDAGHVCQNLYLSCGAIRAGTCAIGAYDQVLMDKLLGVDGNEEFTVYLAPAGKV